MPDKHFALSNSCPSASPFQAAASSTHLSLLQIHPHLLLLLALGLPSRHFHQMKRCLSRFCFLWWMLSFRPREGDSGFSVLMKCKDSYVMDKRYGNRSLVRLIILSDCANASFSMTAPFVMWLCGLSWGIWTCLHLVGEFGNNSGSNTNCLCLI